MARYHREDIRPGVIIELDCGEPVHFPQPRVPSPPDFSAVSIQLDQVKAKIETLRETLRAARARK